MSYQCFVEGCPANHGSKHEICVVASNQSLSERFNEKFAKAHGDSRPVIVSWEMAVEIRDALARLPVETPGDHEADLASQLRQVDRAYRDALKEIDSLRARVPTSDYILLVDTGEVHHKDYGMVLFATHDAIHSVEGIAGSPAEPTEKRCHFMAFRQAEFQCTKPEGHDGPHSCGLAPETRPVEKASEPLVARYECRCGKKFLTPEVFEHHIETCPTENGTTSQTRE